ncbi:hypothetical protein HFP51_06850 [Parasphingopyxis sp. CP4]|uniref:hypothetical protein n=1 Tax=Parasphingopyxis sp. CP4 TaxID=2724527 RepID=UPI0015A38C54|nr:hypothetical protein [Parasphingopyxis sp. CP4]QLC21926.1 hypothetical protein HFP51_06850 [Parasphingopyxis sp. CP4]
MHRLFQPFSRAVAGFALAGAALLAQPMSAVQAQVPVDGSVGARTASALADRGEFFLGLFNGGERDGFMRLGWIKTEDGVILYDRSMMPSAEVYETLAFNLTPSLEFDRVHLQFHRGMSYMVLNLEFTDGRATGSRFIDAVEETETQPVDFNVPDGTLPRPVAFLMPLVMGEAEGTAESFHWYGPLGNAFADVTVTAYPGGEISTPAGDFDTIRYEIRGGSPDNDVYVTRGDNRRVVRIDVVGQDMQFLAVPMPASGS